MLNVSAAAAAAQAEVVPRLQTQAPTNDVSHMPAPDVPPPTPLSEADILKPQQAGLGADAYHVFAADGHAGLSMPCHMQLSVADALFPGMQSF